MAYSNSPLVSYTKLSPNHSGQRTHSIDRITPHCVVGQLSAESICGCFASTSRQASCNYGIGKDGKISLCVEEKNRSWCSSSNANDQRAITIECASDKSEPYAMNSAVYASLIKLCTDICQRNGKRKLLWLGDKNKTLNYAPASDEMVLTVHRWYANKSCPGDWLYARLGDLAEKVTAALNDSPGLQAADLENLTRAETVAKIGPLFTANQKTTGILACVSMAQFILESSYGSSELARKANNCFGMKTSLSGNSWPNSVWDGKSVYTNPTSTRKRSLKLTPELIAEAPDLLHFEKGIYCAFIEKETVKGDVVEFKTTFGVTLTTVGNRRTLNSFRGFKRCNMDGTVEYVDAPYKVYGFSIQYRRYLTMAAKRERKDAV